MNHRYSLPTMVTAGAAVPSNLTAATQTNGATNTDNILFITLGSSWSNGADIIQYRVVFTPASGAPVTVVTPLTVLTSPPLMAGTAYVDALS